MKPERDANELMQSQLPRALGEAAHPEASRALTPLLWALWLARPESHPVPMSSHGDVSLGQLAQVYLSRNFSYLNTINCAM